MNTKSYSEKVIYDNTSDGFDEWKEDYLYDNDENFTDEELWERYNESLTLWADDEKMNLNKTLDGVIVAFADLGFWNGRTTGAMKFSDNLKSIIDTCDCDYIELYCNRYDVKSNLMHHDGTHHLIYRLVPHNKVNKIMEHACNGTLTFEYFRKNSKSIRKYVAEIYGWEK